MAAPQPKRSRKNLVRSEREPMTEPHYAERPDEPGLWQLRVQDEWRVVYVQDPTICGAGEWYGPYPFIPDPPPKAPPVVEARWWQGEEEIIAAPIGEYVAGRGNPFYCRRDHTDRAVLLAWVRQKGVDAVYGPLPPRPPKPEPQLPLPKVFRCVKKINGVQCVGAEHQGNNYYRFVVWADDDGCRPGVMSIESFELDYRIIDAKEGGG